MPKNEAVVANPCSTSKPQIIRFAWTDYSGILRCKAITASRFGSPVFITKACMALMPWGAIADGALAGPVGEVLLVPSAEIGSTSWPQWESPQKGARKLPWHPNHTIAIAEIVNQNGTPWEQCPKAALLRVVDLLREKGINVKAGFELEFGLFTVDPADGKTLKPLGRGAAYASYEQVDIAATFLDDVIICLAQMKITVRMVHAESSPGQFEVVLDFKDIVDSVQDLVLARLAVKAVARKHNLVASFVPNYGDGYGGSGSHVHLSLDGHFSTNDQLYGMEIGVSVCGQAFMAGVLHSLPWLTFLTNSSCLSYLRVLPTFWVGAYQTWGLNNKEAPIRLSCGGKSVEVKLLDGVSNVDLALAGILLAGLRGIEMGWTLPPPCQEVPHAMDDGPRRLPDSLEKSLGEFEIAHKQGLLKDVFENDMVHDLICVKQTEIAYVKKNGISSYRDMLMTLH